MPPRLDDWFSGNWIGLNFAYAVIIKIRSGNNRFK